MSLVLLFSVGAVVAPATAEEAAAAGYSSGAYGGYDSYDLSQYDVRYVAINSLYIDGDPVYGVGDEDDYKSGSNGVSFDGSKERPWRTITFAESQLPYGDPAVDDMIVVGPSAPLWYGGAVPENITIDKPVTIVSRDGALDEGGDMLTGINVGGQPVVPAQVIEIICSDVVIDDLFLTGAEADIAADTGGAGVVAHETTVCVDQDGCCDYLENVKVLNSVIKIDQVDVGWGIVMECVKWPVIDGNHIMVGVEGADLALSVTDAWGILMMNCRPLLVGDVWHMPQVTNNELDIHGDVTGWGIVLDDCPKTLVGVMPDGSNGANDIAVLATGDVLGYGIYAVNCPLIDIMYNMVYVETNGNGISMGWGIWVICSDRSDVIANTVYVEVNIIGSLGGYLYGRGIKVDASHESNINGNDVTVMGTGDINSTAMPPPPSAGIDEIAAEELAELEAMLFETLGIDQCLTTGMGTLVGISVTGCEATMVLGNTVLVDLDVDVVSDEPVMGGGGGGGCAIGISGLGSPGINVNGNGVTVVDDVHTQVTVTENVTPAGFAFGGGISVAQGITLMGSPGGMVSGNSVNADADLWVDVESNGYVLSKFAPDAALTLLDSQILGAVYMQLEETLADEQIDVALSGSLPGIQSLGLGAGIAAGMGILAVHSDGVMITNNTPVNGTGDVEADVESYEEFEYYDAEAAGGGLGFGGGIIVIGCRGATVSGNGMDDPATTEVVEDVHGEGTADVDVGAQHGTGIAQYAGAVGGGAGIGVGILLVGMPGFPLEAEELPEDQCWFDRPVVVGNIVTASGIADPVMVSAVDFFECHESCALGGGLGFAMGIGALWYPGILIEGNMVDADASANVNISAEAVHEFDPASIGGAAAIGIGIGTVGCLHAEILNNVASGDGVAFAMVGATEHVVMSANAFGGSLGLGIGIMVVECPRSLVMGNSHLDPETCLIIQGTVGRGDAETVVTAISYIPLSEAYACSLATGIGKGILVAYSPCTDVIRCNVAAGEGTARATATYDADFGSAGACGFAGSYDIVMKLKHMHPRFLEEEVDELDPQGRPRHRFGDVNYNSIIDDVPLSLEDNVGVDEDEAGLLKIGRPCLDATLNWWNDPTGPMPVGNGEWVKWVGDPVFFSPWLYVEHGQVLCEQIGKFGFFIPMCKGLNTLSTPIALEQDPAVVSPASRTWADIAANSGLDGPMKVKYVNKWVPGTGWQPVAPGDFLDPLDAWYIYLFAPGENVILYVNSDPLHPYAMPTRDLIAGWSLVGPNPIFYTPAMPVKPALSSIELTPGSDPGYVQAISPVVNCQPSWMYVPSMPGPGPLMNSGRGYWVWMENPDKLVGFGFSPLPAGP